MVRTRPKSWVAAPILILGGVLACTDQPSAPGTEAGVRRAVVADTTGPSYYVLVPSGWLYHRSCVHTIEDGAKVGVSHLVTRSDGSTYQIHQCPFPVYKVGHGGTQPVGGSGTTAPGAHEKAVNNGWLEYAQITASSGNWFSQINAKWVVPAAPSTSYGTYDDTLQTYFTFPGIQSNAYILQPVLMYGNGDDDEWLIASWQCDGSSGFCDHSTYKEVSAGDSILGTVAASACSDGVCTWTITTRDISTSTSTIYTLSDTAQNYTLGVGGAVENYELVTCSDYPVNGVFYSAISVYDKNSTQVTPSWSDYPPSYPSPACGFNVTSTSTTVNLYHNPGSSNPITDVSLTQGSYYESCFFFASPTGGGGIGDPYIYTWNVYGVGTGNPWQLDTTSNTTDTLIYYAPYGYSSFEVGVTVGDYEGDAPDSAAVSVSSFSCHQ